MIFEYISLFVIWAGCVVGCYHLFRHMMVLMENGPNDACFDEYIKNFYKDNKHSTLIIMGPLCVGIIIVGYALFWGAMLYDHFFQNIKHK